jgi:hypothetical protein
VASRKSPAGGRVAAMPEMVGGFSRSDSALKKSQHLDEKHKHHGNDSKKHLPDKKISWAEYKKTML